MTRRMMLLAVMGTMALGGCAAVRAPPDDSDLRLQAASHAFGGGFAYMIIHSSGSLGDSVFLNLSRVTGTTPLARELSARLAQAEHGELRILVSGQDAHKTLDVIRDAFADHGQGSLPGLEFLFLGEPRHAATVRRLVEAAGGRMRFAPFET